MCYAITALGTDTAAKKVLSSNQVRLTASGGGGCTVRSKVQ